MISRALASVLYDGHGNQATDASVNDPEGVVFDTLGNMDVADLGNNRIRKVDTNGISPPTGFSRL